MNEFKPVFIECRDLYDCWHSLLININKKGRKYKITEGSFKGSERLSFDYVSGFIHNPSVRPFFPPSNLVPNYLFFPDDLIEQYFVDYLMNSELSKNEDYRYATWLVGGSYRLPSINKEIKIYNQVEWVINHFKQKGFGNSHCYITVGYPESNLAYDEKYNNETDRKTSPCLRGLDFKIIENSLNINVVFRSWDLMDAFPVNMGGITLLNEYIAGELKVNPGALSFSCKDLHIYNHLTKPESKIWVDENNHREKRTLFYARRNKHGKNNKS